MTEYNLIFEDEEIIGSFINMKNYAKACMLEYLQQNDEEAFIDSMQLFNALIEFEAQSVPLIDDNELLKCWYHPMGAYVISLLKEEEA